MSKNLEEKVDEHFQLSITCRAMLRAYWTVSTIFVEFFRRLDKDVGR